MEHHIPETEYYEYDAERYFSSVYEKYTQIIDEYLIEEQPVQLATEKVVKLMQKSNQKLLEQGIINSPTYVGPGAQIPFFTEEGLQLIASTEPLYGTYSELVTQVEVYDDLGMQIPRLYHSVKLLSQSIATINYRANQEAHATVPLNGTGLVGLEFFTSAPSHTTHKERWRADLLDNMDQGNRIGGTVAAFERIQFAKQSQSLTNVKLDRLYDEFLQASGFRNLSVQLEAFYGESVSMENEPELQINPVIAGKILDVGTMKNYGYDSSIQAHSGDPDRWRTLRHDVALIVDVDDGVEPYIMKIPLRAINNLSAR